MQLSHRFGHRDHDRLVELALILLIEQNETIIKNLETIMSALTDAQAALADLATAVTDGISEIETLLAKIGTPGVSEADVAALTAQMTAITTGIKDEVAKAKAAAP